MTPIFVRYRTTCMSFGGEFGQMAEFEGREAVTLRPLRSSGNKLA